MVNKQKCACCGYLTHETDFDICPVCFWQKDSFQESNIDNKGGPNEPSLREARENFKKFAAIQPKLIDKVRAPTNEEIDKTSPTDSKKDNGKTISALIFLGVLAVATFVHFRSIYLLRNYGVYTTGHIIGNGYFYKGTFRFKYDYYVNGKKYEEECTPRKFDDNIARDFEGKSFPVLYYPKRPGLSDMSITAYDFEEYDRPFPDSLKWILRYQE